MKGVGVARQQLRRPPPGVADETHAVKDRAAHAALFHKDHVPASVRGRVEHARVGAVVQEERRADARRDGHAKPGVRLRLKAVAHGDVVPPARPAGDGLRDGQVAHAALRREVPGCHVPVDDFGQRSVEDGGQFWVGHDKAAVKVGDKRVCLVEAWGWGGVKKRVKKEVGGATGKAGRVERARHVFLCRAF